MLWAFMMYWPVRYDSRVTMMILDSRSASARRVAPAVYTTVVGAARAPVLYSVFGVADTIEGRYEMIALHAILLLRRLRRGTPAELRPQSKLAQAVVDYMAADLDRSMRELGVGDLSVSRQMKHLGEGLYGRAEKYDAALDRGDAEALARALLRNVYDDDNPGAGILTQFAAYVAHQDRHLAAQAADAILAGQVDFLSPDGDAA
jgi:cytochrome b pre-mRNA-processing protein 3